MVSCRNKAFCVGLLLPPLGAAHAEMQQMGAVWGCWMWYTRHSLEYHLRDMGTIPTNGTCRGQEGRANRGTRVHICKKCATEWNGDKMKGEET